MLNKILKVSKEKLNSINLDSYRDSFIKNGYPNSWFFMEAGQEHYRLLAYIGSLYKGQTLLDIGTYQGNSAIALSHNKNNDVISYDLKPQPIIGKIKSKNTKFKIGNILELGFKEIILSCPFIMLDTFHNGDFEAEFVNYLTEIKYKGLVLFDDIHLNKPMQDFWNGLKLEKYDITEIGHFSGTGLVRFK